MTTMTRVHFKLIADGLAESKPSTSEYFGPDYAAAILCWREVVNALARKFRATNPSFNFDRFLEACDYGD